MSVVGPPMWVIRVSVMLGNLGVRPTIAPSLDP
jgi:hypothetical protein